MNVCSRTNWQTNAEQLWEEGYTFFPLDEALVEPARCGFKQFLQRRKLQSDQRDWCLQRPGEDESDLGLIQRYGGEYDVKSFFHHDSSLLEQLTQQRLLYDARDTEFLSANSRLLKGVNDIGCQLVEALDELYNLDCSADYLHCLQNGAPYCATTLRSLFYPAGPLQTGAKAHIDRSFLTIHLGDEGGSLQVLIDGQWENISPPAGYGVAFFGVKVLWLTAGTKQPLRHRSVTFPGSDRFAFVHFGHVQLRGYQVTNAQIAQKDWQELQTA